MSGRLARAVALDDFDQLVQRFILAPKIGVKRCRWRRGIRMDYVSASIPLAVSDMEHLRARLDMTAHLNYIPRKYSFSLIFNNKRVLGLDVEPRRSHRNLRDRRVVTCTHWQEWPLMDARPDDRLLSHQRWLDEFCRKAHIALASPYRAPPLDRVQLRLPL